MKELQHEQKNSNKDVHLQQVRYNTTKNPVAHGRSKHIKTIYHFIRHQIKEKNVKPMQVQIVDVFMKPLKLEIFLKLKEKLGMANKFEGVLRVQNCAQNQTWWLV